MSKIELGNEVKDKVTGFVGVATSRVEYLNGCVQFGLQGKVSDDNKIPDAIYIDQQQLENLKDNVKVEKSNTGGIRSDIPRGIGLAK